MRLSTTPLTWTTIAANDDRFTDFAPYVASIDDAGRVAFQATLPDGHTGVFIGDGDTVDDVAVTSDAACPVTRFASHPDIDRAGDLSVYGVLANGEQAALRITPDGRVTSAGARDGLSGIGPLGPTANRPGDIALRATTRDGRACIAAWRGLRCERIAEAGERFQAFDGLPVVNDAGLVVFRADAPDGRQLVVLQRGEGCDVLASTGEGDLAELGRFPVLTDRGLVAFVARRASGGWGIFTVDADAGAGSLACVHASEPGFESFRGVLANDAGLVAFYGTPTGGRLGLYTGPGARHDRVLGLGDPLFGSVLVDFALNPVSVNVRGQLAVRVALDDGRQFILRGDPVSS